MESAESRRLVTVLFCDVAGSTSLAERLDAETLRLVLGRYFDAARSTVERHGGSVEKFVGDAVMAVFGIPDLHEDDALRAVRAAVDLRVALVGINDEIQRRYGVTLAARMGVNTGEVAVGDPTRAPRISGDSINVAARLEQAASPHEILISLPTYRLVRHAVEVEAIEPLALKGKTFAVGARRVVQIADRVDGRPQRFDAPLVGRQLQLRHLRAAYAEVVNARRCSLVTILGSAGVGKSRLVSEFVSSVTHEARVLRGHCLSYGDGNGYWPIGEAIRLAAGIDDDDGLDDARDKVFELVHSLPDGAVVASRLTPALGLGGEPARQEDVFWSVLRCLEVLSLERPVVLVVDDIQWAEATLLDLLDHIADRSGRAAILLICVARPELLEMRQRWTRRDAHRSTIRLGPLPSRAAEGLIDRLLAGTSVIEPVRHWVAEAAEGNPLFIEELVSTLIEEGVVRQEYGRWVTTTDLATVAAPLSIQAVLAARLDRLAPGERITAQRASIAGRTFDVAGLGAITPAAERRLLVPALDALSRRGLVRREGAAPLSGAVFSFRHPLIREAAYATVPKTARAEAHERFARWLERASGDRRDESVEIVAHHLDEALRYRTELAIADRGGRLARRTAETWIRAAEKSTAAGSYAEAARQLRRGLTLTRSLTGASGLPPTTRHRLVEKLAQAHRLAGEPDVAATVLREGLVSGDIAATGDELALVHERIGRCLWDAGDGAGARAAYQDALRLLTGDRPGARAIVLAGRARLQVVSGRHRDSVPVARSAVRLARECGLPVVEGDALNTLGVALGRLGASDEGIAALESSLEIARRHGDGHGLIRAYNNLAIALEAAGRFDEASSTELAGYAVAKELGLQRSIGAFIGTGAAVNALAEGRLLDADRLTREIIEDGATGSRAAQALVIRAQAKLHLGAVAEAVDAAAAARRAAGRTHGPRDLADVCITEAEIATEQGASSEAVACVVEAFGIADESGQRLAIEPRSRWFAVGLRVAADAIQARGSGGDDVDLAGARNLAGSLVERLAVFRRAFDPEYPADRYHRVLAACTDAEITRVRGASDPLAWETAIDTAAGARFRLHEAYARWRLVEALLDRGCGADAISAASRAASGPAVRRASPRIAGHIAALRRAAPRCQRAARRPARPRAHMTSRGR